MIEFMLNRNEWVQANWALAILVTVSALVTYARLAFEEGPMRMFWPRSIIAVGFTLLALRFWLSMYLDKEAHVAPMAMVSLGMIFGGYCVVQIRAIKRAIHVQRINLRCLRDHDLACAREDRLREAVMFRHQK